MSLNFLFRRSPTTSAFQPRIGAGVNSSIIRRNKYLHNTSSIIKQGRLSSQLTNNSISNTRTCTLLKAEKFTSSSSSSSSSWMKKNQNFQRYESQQPLTFSNNNNNKTDKQRRRRNDKRKEEYNLKIQNEQEANFRLNFRGTRVFVQNIPQWVTWQSLKDHFKVAGNVVFASVSIDTNTGKSKGCGVVQFETTDMAQNAIEIMRNQPLEDGTVLYVREDFQEEDASKSLSLGRRGSTPPAVQWRCAEEENLTLLSSEALTTVKALIKARDEARRRKNYETSDNIREDLKTRFSVHIDDRLKQWWVSADNIVPKSISEMKGDGRWGNLKPWRQIPTTPENDSCVSADLVNGLLKQRDIARREKDFKTADMLLEEARDAPDGELYLRIHDESRTWRVWTPEKPPSPMTKHETAMSPADQCIALVNKNDPNKVDEVRNLLKKFPGREWNILKKLREKYDE